MKQKYKDKDGKIIEIDVCPHCKGLGELHFEHNPRTLFLLQKWNVKNVMEQENTEEYLNT